MIGVLLGFLAGLGVGGGTLLILWLTSIVGLGSSEARLINLMFFLASAGSVSLIRLRRRIVPWKSLLPAILSGCLMTVLFTHISYRIDTALLKKAFGALLIITGFREIRYREQ